MNIAARSSALARRATAPLRVALPGAAAAITAIAVSGCAPHSPGTPTVHASKAAVRMTSPPASSPATLPTAATATQVAATPSAASTAPATPVPASPAGPGALTATVKVLGAGSSLVPGAPAVRFRVTVTNRSAQTYSNVLPLVSLGHCTCTASTLFPAGSLLERESTTNIWQAIPYVVEGFGTDYLKVAEPGGIQEISPGGVASFEYRVALKPVTSAQVTTGQAALDVTLIALPGHTPIGPTPAASAPIGVQAGQPPA